MIFGRMMRTAAVSAAFAVFLAGRPVYASGPSGYSLEAKGNFTLAEGETPVSPAVSGHAGGPLLAGTGNGAYRILTEAGGRVDYPEFQTAYSLGNGCTALVRRIADDPTDEARIGIVGNDGTVLLESSASVIRKLTDYSNRFYLVIIPDVGGKIFDTENRTFVPNILLDRANDELRQVGDTFFVSHTTRSSEIYSLSGELITEEGAIYTPIGSYYFFPTKDGRRCIYSTGLQELFGLKLKNDVTEGRGGQIVYSETEDQVTLYGIISESGEPIVPPAYSGLRRLSNDCYLDWVYNEAGNRIYGILSPDCLTIADPKYDSVSDDLDYGMLLSKTDIGGGVKEYKIFDRHNLLYAIQSSSLSENLVASREADDGGLDYYVVSSGNYSLHADNRKSYPVGQNLLALYDSEAHHYSLVDLWTGTVLLPAEYDYFVCAWNNVYAAKDNAYEYFGLN